MYCGYQKPLNQWRLNAILKGDAQRNVKLLLFFFLGVSALPTLSAMEENGSEDGFVIMRNSMIQELLDRKCGGCGSRNFVSWTESTVALVTIFFVRCRVCGKQELVNTRPRTIEEFRQVDKLITDYALRSKGGKELVRDLFKMKNKEEFAKEMDEEINIKEEIQEIKEEIDIKEEKLDIDLMKTSNELEVPETIEASIGLVENADLLNRYNHEKEDEQEDVCCMCTPVYPVSSNRHLCHYCGDFCEDIATHLQDSCGQGLRRVQDGRIPPHDGEVEVSCRSCGSTLPLKWNGNNPSSSLIAGPSGTHVQKRKLSSLTSLKYNSGDPLSSVMGPSGTPGSSTTTSKCMAARQANAVEVIAERARIVGMWESGLAVMDIALQTGRSSRMIRKWIRRWKEEGSVRTRPRSGRPRVTSPTMDAHIVTAAQEHPMTSAVQLTRSLELPCHPQTIRRRLQEQGIH